MNSSLEKMYEQYVGDVYRYLYSLSYDHHVAEDLMQETFYRAYLYLEECREEKVKPWLFRVAYHAYIDYRRKENRSSAQEPTYFQQFPDKDTPERQILQQEKWALIKEELILMPENQRQSMLLVDFHELSYQEAADVMGIRLSHVKILLFRARERVRAARRKDNTHE